MRVARSYAGSVKLAGLFMFAIEKCGRARGSDLQRSEVFPRMAEKLGILVDIVDAAAFESILVGMEMSWDDNRVCGAQKRIELIYAGCDSLDFYVAALALLHAAFAIDVIKPIIRGLCTVWIKPNQQVEEEIFPNPTLRLLPRINEEVEFDAAEDGRSTEFRDVGCEGCLWKMLVVREHDYREVGGTDLLRCARSGGLMVASIVSARWGMIVEIHTMPACVRGSASAPQILFEFGHDPHDASLPHTNSWSYVVEEISARQPMVVALKIATLARAGGRARSTAVSLVPGARKSHGLALSSAPQR